MTDRAQQAADFIGSEYSSTMQGKRIKEYLWPSMLATTDAGDDHRPFGYNTPQYFTHHGTWCFFFCPEVIAEATAVLDDNEFGEWLRYMRAHLNAHAAYGNIDETEIDSHVFDVMPEARDLIAKIFEAMFVI